MSRTILTIDEVAERFRIPLGTLRYYRVQRIGPPSFRRGRRVVYFEDDVIKWQDAQFETDPARKAAGA